MKLTLSQQRRIRDRVIAIAERLGRAAGDRAVDEETCSRVGLLGRYEYENLGLADSEPEFAQRLHATLERIDPAGSRFSREVEQDAWRAWMYARNERVKALCPRAREYGDE